MKYFIILITLFTCLNCSTKKQCNEEAFRLLGQLNQTEYEYAETYGYMYYRINGVNYRCRLNSNISQLKVIPFFKTEMSVEKAMNKYPR